MANYPKIELKKEKGGTIEINEDELFSGISSVFAISDNCFGPPRLCLRGSGEFAGKGIFIPETTPSRQRLEWILGRDSMGVLVLIAKKSGTVRNKSCLNIKDPTVKKLKESNLVIKDHSYLSGGIFIKGVLGAISLRLCGNFKNRGIHLPDETRSGKKINWIVVKDSEDRPVLVPSTSD